MSDEPVFDADEVSVEPETEGVNSLSKDPRVEKLKEELQKCRAERQEYLDGWQRMRADVVNMRKEHEAVAGWAMHAGKMALVEDLFGVLDSFDAAFAGEAWQKVDANWRAGVEYIYAQMLRALAQHGIEPFGAVGDLFDPHMHDVAEERPASPENPSNTVVTVLQKGYRSQDKLVRPARVVVAS